MSRPGPGTSGTLPYVLPFLVFLVFLFLDGKLGLSPEVEYPLRVLVLSGVIWFFSRGVLDLRVRQFVGSILIGILVFVIWIGPDLVFPMWRQHWLFQNSVMGSAPVPDGGYASQPLIALIFRTARAVVIVPIVEELFWRGWLMRYLINPDFEKLPLGMYEMRAFIFTALLFAAEHGSYWEVGLAAGILYNWWIVRTKSLGDCILAHAVTNGVLSAYTITTGKWQYW